MATVQIFLSAVTAEFRSYRDALRKDLERPNVTVKVQEDFIATGTETLDKLDTYIRECDATIHLVGNMTGALAQQPSVTLIRQRYADFGERFSDLQPYLQPDAPALSYTQWEAWLTLYHRKILIIAVPEPGATRDPGYVVDEAQQSAQQNHLARLAKVERYPEIRFNTADRLAVDVMRSGLQEILLSARVSARPVRTVPKPRDDKRRYLRGYAFDPQLQMRLGPGVANEILYSIPKEPLTPGPSGDLIEVIDHDPASGCFYEPVDLEHPALLTEDGLAPSEADPRFHQQMVYAVAMTTIERFEQALGRRVLLSGRDEPGPSSSSFVRKFRLYPHALRAPNAHYDPKRKAILFGYHSIPAHFSPQNIYPDGVVFTCLSQQAIAGEMARALVAEMFPAFAIVDSRDMLALLLALADIIALLQHFSTPGVLRHVFALPGAGRLTGLLLGQLATKLAGASTGGGALRDGIGAHDDESTRRLRAPDATAYVRAQEATKRGATIVAAIFDAYISIVEGRTRGILRSYTDEPDGAERGALPQEIVEALEDEAAGAAHRLLGICLRALDYCPPVDVNAGDFLRALITADNQAMPQDTIGYRAAIVDAFRAHGIHPLGFRSLSVEMLPWDPPADVVGRLLQTRIGSSLRLWVDRLAVLDDLGAAERFDILRKCSFTLHEELTKLLASLKAEDLAALAGELGFDPAVPFAVFPPRVATSTTHGGRRVFISVVQKYRAAADVEQGHEGVRLRGGSTIAVKFGTWDIEHVVRKRMRVA